MKATLIASAFLIVILSHEVGQACNSQFGFYDDHYMYGNHHGHGNMHHGGHHHHGYHSHGGGLFDSMLRSDIFGSGSSHHHHHRHSPLIPVSHHRHVHRIYRRSTHSRRSPTTST